MERVENYRIAKRVCVGECAGSRSFGRPRKRWIDTVKNCLKKRGLDVREARRLVYDGFVRGVMNVSAILRKWEMTGLLKGYMWRSV